MRTGVTTCVVLLVIALALLARCCDDKRELEARLDDCEAALEECEKDGGGADPVAHLVVEGRSAGDWIQFATLPDGESCDPSDVTYRPAVLFQFGRYASDPDLAFEEIRIYAEGSETPDVYAREDEDAGDPLCWIDVVADYPDRPDPPMDPDAILGLYPDAALEEECSSHPCEERHRTIHGDMTDVQAVLTYWPGPAGYSMTAAQPTDAASDILDPCWGSHYRFSFPDAFRVEVYTPGPDGAGTPVKYDAGAVDSIVVRTTVDTTPEKDEMQEPPWPRP